MKSSPHLLKRALRAYWKALLTKLKLKAWKIITQVLVQPIPTERVYLDIIGPAQRKLETHWKKGKISTADERMATAISEFVVSRLQMILVKTPPHSPKALVICPPSN